MRKSRRAKCALHWHSPEQKMPIFVSTGLGHCLVRVRVRVRVGSGSGLGLGIGLGNPK